MVSCPLRIASSVSGDHAWAVLRVPLAGLLLSAVVVKFWFAREILASDGMLSQPWLLPVAAGAEAGAGLTILLAPAWRGYLVAAASFSALAAVSGWSLATGRDCGCFGPQTNTFGPFLLDVACLLALAFVHPRPTLASKMQRSRTILIGAASVAIALCMGAISERLMAGREGIPAFFGDNLVGRQWPLLEREDFPATAGGIDRSLFVLLRPDCGHCREFARLWSEQPLPGWELSQIFCISLGNAKWTVTPGVVAVDPIDVEGAVTLSWDLGAEPFVATPAIFVVDDQVVHCAVDGEAALDALLQEFPQIAFCPQDDREE